jgi:glycosyltransferase involved in cell wall biosynthesis
MWAFTGHCGYSLDSERWRIGCGHCPYLDSYPAVQRDATHLNWRVKQAVYRALDLTLVTPSQWLAGLVRESPLLRRCDVHVIPYGLDLERFAPSPKAEARRRLRLDLDEPVVLAVGPERRKGSQLLQPIVSAAARLLSRRITLLVVAAEDRLPDFGEHVRMQQVRGVPEDGMPTLYAAADVHLLPTTMDNLPNSALEALACGVPTVATGVGGLAEIVEDGRTGLLRPVDADALAHAVVEVLTDSELRARMGLAAREDALAKFGLDRQADGYAELYDAQLARRGIRVARIG